MDCAKKKKYFNYLLFDGHLIAVTASANRSKGARGPEQWQPDKQDYWCKYAVNWITVKDNWSLTATANEWDALVNMLDTCPNDVVIEGSGAQPTAEPAPVTPPPESQPTPDGPGCDQAQVDVNSAPAGELDRIIHIGPVRAADMINLRPFNSVDDLTRISGIGPARLADIKARV